MSGKRVNQELTVSIDGPHQASTILFDDRAPIQPKDLSTGTICIPRAAGGQRGNTRVRFPGSFLDERQLFAFQPRCCASLGVSYVAVDHSGETN
jgi:hypothetical protein